MWSLFGKSNNRNAIPSQRFDGIRAIQAHLDHRTQVEEYVHGLIPDKPEVHTDCCIDCMVGKWLHGAGGNLCSDISLLDALHQSCHDFREAAAQAVLLADMGKSELAMSIVRDGRFFGDASDRYQLNLAKLHLACERA